MHRVTGLLLIAAWLSVSSDLTQPACPDPLDDKTLNALATNVAEIDLEPGQSFPFVLGAAEGCHSFQPVKPCVSWSVEPAKGARIDAGTGAFTVDKSAPHGSVFTVKADVEGGRRIVSTKVRVYTREANPLVGRWKQERPDAGGGAGAGGRHDYIEELVFKADGTFSVTWLPFECYKDYWGTYSSDTRTRRLRLNVQGGNNVPADLDGDGTFAIDDSGRLTLKDICLGSKAANAKGAGCGLVFRRAP